MTIIVPEGVKTLTLGGLKALTPTVSKITELVLPKTLREFDDSVMKVINSVESLEFHPDSCCKLPWFQGNKKLKKLVMPDTINKISISWFEGCTSLEFIRLPKNLELIRRDAFKRTSSLKEVVWPKTAVTVEEQAFFKSGLEKISGAVFKSLGDESFSLTPLREASVKVINDSAYTVGSAFSNCKQLEQCTIRCEAPEMFFEEVFKDDDTLREVNLEGTVTVVLPNTFANCPELRVLRLSEETKVFASELDKAEVVIDGRHLNSESFLDKALVAENIEEIGYFRSFGSIALTNCLRFLVEKLPSVKELVNDMTVKKYPVYDAIIGDATDCYDEASQTVTLREDLLDSEYNCLEARNDSIIYKAKRLVFTAGCTSFNDHSLNRLNSVEELIFEDDCPIKRIDFRMFNSCDSLVRVVLPKQLESIGDYCFRECKNLREVVWPDRLIEIGKESFSSSALESLKGVKFSNVGDYAFSSSTLREVDLTLGQPERRLFASIDELAFSNCCNLRRVTVNCLADSSIEKGAFAICPVLEELHLKGKLVEMSRVSSKEEHSFTERVTLGKMSCCDKLSLTVIGKVLKASERQNSYELHLTGNLKMCNAKEFTADFTEFILDDEFVMPIGALSVLPKPTLRDDWASLPTLRELLESLYPEQFAVYYEEHGRIIEELEETSLF